MAVVHIRNLKEIANLNKELVLGDPPRRSKTILSRFLILGPFPKSYLGIGSNLGIGPRPCRAVRRKMKPTTMPSLSSPSSYRVGMLLFSPTGSQGEGVAGRYWV